MKVKIKTYKIKRGPRRIDLLLFIILSFSLFLILSFLPKKESFLKQDISFTQDLQEESPSLKVDKQTIRRGMTLTDLLAPYHFSPAEIYELQTKVKPVYDLSKIKAGHEFRICTSQQGDFISLEYDIDDKNYLLIKKEEEEFKAEIIKIPYKNSTVMIWGTINDNLISAVRKEEESVQLALNLADLFAWDIDFSYDIRKGDSFKIIFEKRYREGEFVGYGNILAAEFTNQGKTFQAFRYIYPDTDESDHFDLEGNSLRKEFLKSPIRYTRITSRFSHRRLHPIRKVFRPHYGVDYAAPVGTPVQATADGTVVYAGRRGPSGRMIHIRHNNRYETMYLHLRGYAGGISKGARIRGGQIIASVGSSGESTGPHLDYRIKKDGRYINPLTFNPPPVEPLRIEFLEDFKRKTSSLCLCLDAPRIIVSSYSSSLGP